MLRICISLGTVLMLAASAAHAGEPEKPVVPAAVGKLSGCWQGTGEVMGKPVVTTLEGRPILLGAMFAVDTDSRAREDTSDHYAAHLLFGGTMVLPGSSNDIVGYWADSFGGAMTSNGTGTSSDDGFDITYEYPDALFVNRWRVDGERLYWRITAREAGKGEQPFAEYTLTRIACPSAGREMHR